ncbi:MAG TPA: hypothetical protein VK186_09725 [Candidatus Deferrimicrobium sp.]|nr:hypothetical protein [Candidatus Kapabacteria bacterium]HLP59099.1 hypothetical protein [Candidatus Deferrimicrobium sp.]
MDKKKLKSIFWDYEVNYTGEELYDFLVGKKEINELTRNRVIARMLTSMRWYDLVDIFGIQQLYKFLNDDVFRFIWKKSLKNRFKNVRETLQTVL